jgi:hypothetical protein
MASAERIFCGFMVRAEGTPVVILIEPRIMQVLSKRGCLFVDLCCKSREAIEGVHEARHLSPMSANLFFLFLNWGCN